MKKIFSMICALSIAASTMIAAPVAEAANFVEDNQPRIIAECSSVLAGFAIIDYYLDFGKYDFLAKCEDGTYKNALQQDKPLYSAKGCNVVSVSVDVSDYGFTSELDLPPEVAGNLTGESISENASKNTIEYLFSQSSAELLFVPAGKTKLFTMYAQVGDGYDVDKVNAEINLPTTAIVYTWTINQQKSTSSYDDKGYGEGAANPLTVIFGDVEQAVVTLGDAAGTVATKDANTGKVWNNVKVEEVSKATSYKAVFTDKATGEKAEFAINGLTGDEVNGDATFAVILKLVEKVANSADILLDIVCE